MGKEHTPVLQLKVGGVVALSIGARRTPDEYSRTSNHDYVLPLFSGSVNLFDKKT